MSITQIKNAPNKYIYGLELRWQGDDEIDIHAGAARSEDNLMDLVLESTFQINMNKKGAGGIDFGPYIPNEFYAIYIIGDATGYNPVSAVASTSQVLPVLPPGYTSYRRLGFIRTAGVAEVVDEFYQVTSGASRATWFGVPIDVGGLLNADSYTYQSLNDSVPGVVQEGFMHAYLQLTFLPSAGGNTASIIPADQNITIAPAVITGSAALQTEVMTVKAVVHVTQGIPGIEYKVTNAADSLFIKAMGFEDHLG